jgi:hypothetical protein
MSSGPSAVFTQSPARSFSIRSPSLLSLGSLVAERPVSNNTRRKIPFGENGLGAAASSSSSSSSSAAKNKTQPSSRFGIRRPAGRPAGSAAASGANSDSAGSLGSNLFEPRPGYLKGSRA